MSISHLNKFHREKTALKYYLLGRDYHLALKALGFAERYHVGLRKDGKTPEFHHQIEIALSVTQLKNLINEELCITVALLHDVQEDYQIPQEVIEREFGVEVAKCVWLLTKKMGKLVKDKEIYINEIALCAVASIVKGCDRKNNLETMVGVFTVEKMRSYAEEAEKFFLPMLKTAAKMFPEQQSAYTSIQLSIKQLIKWTNFYCNQVAQHRQQLSNAEHRVAAERSASNLHLKTARDDLEKIKTEVNDLISNVDTQNGVIKQLLAETGYASLKELHAAFKHGLILDPKKRDEADHKKTIDNFFNKIIPFIKSSCKQEDQAEITSLLMQALKISTLELVQYSSKVTDPINES